ncbi:MAG TPA: CBS domain-containing protein [Polyangiaceae bacterium]
MYREQPTFVPVRRLEQLGGATRLTAFCPRKEHSVDLLGCLECEHRITLSLDHAEGQSGMQCRTPAPGKRQVATAVRPSDAERTQLSEILPLRSTVVRADMDLESVAQLLLERGLNGVPVVDKRGEAIGVVSKTDLLRYQQTEVQTYQASPNDLDGTDFEGERGLHLEQPSTAKVADAMTPLAFTLPETSSIARAAALMAFEHVQQVPVTGPDRAVVGMVGSADILRWVARRAGYIVEPS